MLNNLTGRVARKRAEGLTGDTLPPRGVSRIIVGVGLIATSGLALAAPLAAGTWSLQFLSLIPFVVGLNDIYMVVRTPEARNKIISYLAGSLAIAVAVLLFFSPALVIAGVVVLLIVFLAANGALKLLQASLGRDARMPPAAAAANGASNICLALIGWFLWRKVNVGSARSLRSNRRAPWTVPDRPLSRSLLRPCGGPPAVFRISRSLLRPCGRRSTVLWTDRRPPRALPDCRPPTGLVRGDGHYSAEAEDPHLRWPQGVESTAGLPAVCPHLAG